MFQIREEDLRWSNPDPMAVHRARLVEGHRRASVHTERTVLWHIRRNLALAFLAGYVPPTSTERWWYEHEDDALAYAELFS